MLFYILCGHFYGSCKERSRGCLNIKRSSHQYSPMTILSLTWESPYLGKTVFVLRQGPGYPISGDNALCRYVCQGTHVYMHWLSHYISFMIIIRSKSSYRFVILSATLHYVLDYFAIILEFLMKIFQSSLPIFFRITALAPGQFYNLEANEATIKTVGKWFTWIHHEPSYNHKTTRQNISDCIFYGVYQWLNARLQDANALELLRSCTKPLMQYIKSSCKTSNIRRTTSGNKIVNHSDVVGASPVGAAPTTSSFST